MKKTNGIKKMLAILFCVLLVLSAVPLYSFAEEPHSFEFKTVGDEVTLVRCKPGTATDIEVPEIYNDKPVTVIEDGAFTALGYTGADGEDVSYNVTLPKTIKKIGFMSFGMSNVAVTNLNELSNLEYIGAYAFALSNLSGDIVLSDKVTYVGASAFTYTDITSLHLGKNVNIPQPESSKKVVQYMVSSSLSFFAKQANLSTTVSEKSIALCCQKLKKITVDLSNPNYRSVNGVLYSKDMTKLYAYPSGKQNTVFIMPSTVDAFYNAFGGFYITPVNILGMTFDIFEQNNFIPSGSSSDEQGGSMLNKSSKFASNLKNIVISDRVSEIVDIAFYNTGIESVFISKSVTNIGKKAFWHCTDLTTVGFDRNSSFKSLPEECFKDCTSLKNITFGRINYLESLVFGNCSALERVDLTNVMAIESTAFDGCDSLTDIVYQNTESEERATVSAQAFDNTASLENVMLGNSVEKIEDKAFANCQNLKSAYISEEIESISDTAFDGCDNLTIFCPSEECYAYSYAKANNIPVTTLQVMPIPNQTYTGEAIEPEITVKSSGQVLKQGNDYSTYFKDNIEAGLATVNVLGEGKYSMFASVCKFAIVQRNINDGVSVGEIAPQVLNGEKAEPEVTLSYNGRTLQKDTDYAVEYMDNTEAGTAAAVIMGKNNFVGVCTVQFEIIEPDNKNTGDANNDGTIDINDYAMVKNYVTCQSKLTDAQKEFADINKDGTVDIFDAIAIDCIIHNK